MGCGTSRRQVHTAESEQAQQEWQRRQQWKVDDGGKFAINAKNVGRLPIEEYKPVEELSVKELKTRLKRYNLTGIIEKKQLVDLCRQQGGSSNSSCAICCEDYITEDALRVLPCEHRFHLECIDKWMLKATGK
jgi:E3 ubiquitin-protein ligase RNF38/44